MVVYVEMDGLRSRARKPLRRWLGHTFIEGPYLFNAQLHYVWNCGEGRAVHDFLCKLGLEEVVTFEQDDRQGFDRMRMPGYALDVPWSVAPHPSPVASAFFSHSGARMIDQHLVHGTGGDGKKRSATLPIDLAAGQLEPGLVHEVGSLERRLVGPQLTVDHALEVGVDERQETVEGVLLATCECADSTTWSRTID